MSDKNCMNCICKVPEYDRGICSGQHCKDDPDVKVNSLMTCDHWRSDDVTANMKHK